MKQDLDTRFMYHPPRQGQPEVYEYIRAHARWTAEVLEMLCPECREKSLAFTKLEEAVMWANAAIARHDKDQAAKKLDHMKLEDQYKSGYPAGVPQQD